MLFAEGRNAVQMQHWLGHHSAAFSSARKGATVAIWSAARGGPAFLLRIIEARA
jgi:hypothetical protein